MSHKPKNVTLGLLISQCEPHLLEFRSRISNALICKLVVIYLSSHSQSLNTCTASCQWRQTGGSRMTVRHRHGGVAAELTTSWGGVGGGEQEVRWRWESPATLEVSVFPPIAETKTGLNLQLNPWPAFDLVSGTGGGGQRAGQRGGSECKMGACCCFEVPPRIWNRPIKQDYKTGTTFLLKLSVRTLIPQEPNKASFYRHLWRQELNRVHRSNVVRYKWGKGLRASDNGLLAPLINT